MGISGVGNSPSPPPSVENREPIDVPDYEPPGVVEKTVTTIEALVDGIVDVVDGYDDAQRDKTSYKDGLDHAKEGIDTFVDKVDDIWGDNT